MRRRGPCIALLALASLAGLTGPAQAQLATSFEDLIKRVPQSANTLMLVDVEGLFNSPLGQSENWKAQAERGSVDSLGLSTEATKAVVAMSTSLHTLQEVYKLSMVAMESAPSGLGGLARQEGGLLETVENTSVVWTPRDMYLYLIPPNVVGFASPAERQQLGQWLQQTVINPRNAVPGYASHALSRVRAGSQVALAVDLDNAISPQIAAAWLGTIPSLEQAKIDPKILAARLSTARSVTLTVNVTRTIESRIRIDFEQPVDYAAIVAKDVVLALMDSYGVAIPDVQTWSATVDGKTMELAGRLSEESLRRLLEIGLPPRLSPKLDSLANAPETSEGVPPVVEPTPNDVLKVSQRYFREVADMIGALKKQDASTHASAKIWYDKYAKRIEELPILGVDQELLDWGYTVARTFREMANGINYSAKNQTYTVAGRPNGAGGAYYGGYGVYYANSIGYDQAVIKRQSDAVLSTELTSRFEVLEISAADMRRKMVQKYQVDF